MKTAKAAALLAVILLLSTSFGACSANNAAAETEASQQTPEATSTPDVTVELDTSEDKGAGKSNAGSMSVDEQRYASVLDLYYQALYAHQAGSSRLGSRQVCGGARLGRMYCESILGLGKFRWSFESNRLFFQRFKWRWNE